MKWNRLLALMALLLALTGCTLVDVQDQPTPAPEVNEEDGAAQADPGAGVVFEMTDENYIQTMVEMLSHLPEYEGAKVIISGQVHDYGDEHPDLPINFAIMRDYVLEGEEDFVALDCYYEGEKPGDGEWIEIEGMLYSYVIEDEGEEYSAPLIMVQSIKAVEAREPLQVTAEAFEHTH